MTNAKTFLVFLSALLQISLQDADKNSFYKAAVVDFSPGKKQEDNIRDYVWFIQQTKQEGADIVVFPEKTLHGTEGDVEDKLSIVPDPRDGKVPCGNLESETSKVMERLSCAAQENTIYVVVNLMERVPCNESDSNCPGEGRFVYDTNVVFDKNGMVISRYRKYNVYDEYFVSRTDEPEFEYFDTDFGVRFGSLVSFDLLFRTPAIDLVEKYNVTNFVCPSYWLGELPFMTALQIQSGWSYAMNVNLLAAGASKPSTGAGGSGIHLGKKGTLICSMPDREASVASVGVVPKDIRTLDGESKAVYRTGQITMRRNENATRSRLMLQRDPTVSHFRSLELKDGESELAEEVCTGNGLCCRFRATYRRGREPSIEARTEPYRYRAVAYRGDKSLSKDILGGVEACAIILCAGPDIESCGKRPEPVPDYLVFAKIVIEADFVDGDSVQMPNILLDSGSYASNTKLIPLSPGHYDFRAESDAGVRRVRMTLRDELNNLITFGAYSRDFGREASSAARAPAACLASLLVSRAFLARLK